MDAVVLAVLHAAVVDAAAGHDGHVAVVPHEEVVVHQVGQTALAEDHGDVDGLVLGARLDDDVDAVLVGLGYDVDVGGGVPAGLFAVGPDVIGPFGTSWSSATCSSKFFCMASMVLSPSVN